LPTRLILVRHGQTEHNVAGKIAGWTDSPLSATGVAQAESVAEHVAASYALDVLYSSPLQRARDTARAIGRRVGLGPVVRNDLKELNFGDLENTTEAEIARVLPEAWLASRDLADYDFAWPNGERRGDFFDRVRLAFASIVAAHPGKTVGVVAHGAVLGSFLGGVAEGRPHLWQKYLVRNCSVSEVEARGETLTVVRLGDHSFLPDSAPDPLIQALARS
jgi:broad specificity phosphatase PhoE